MRFILRNRLIDLLEEADFECAVGSRPNLLTIVVAGGGFAGTETIAAVNDLLHESIRFYRHLFCKHGPCGVGSSGQGDPPGTGPKTGRVRSKETGRAQRRDSSQYEGGRAGGDAVELSDGSRVPAKTVIWTTGTSPNPLVAALPCK
jgi:NADH dehydrogenase